MADPRGTPGSQVALNNLESGEGGLLIEWSAPRAGEIDDVNGWRLASPHWTAQRQRLIGKQLEAALMGEAEISEDEADPVEAFRAQWLNQWPLRSIPSGTAETLLPAGALGLPGRGPLLGPGAGVRGRPGRLRVTGRPSRQRVACPTAASRSTAGSATTGTRRSSICNACLRYAGSGCCSLGRAC